MEALGLAIGILALIKPTAEAISDLWTSGQNFSGDASRIRLRFAVQLTRLKSFERVLFEPGKFPLVQGRLFDHLAPDPCENFVELLRQLYELLLQYYAVRKRYALEDDREGVASAALITSAQGRAEIISSGRARDEKLAKAMSWVKKARWVVGDKKSAEKLVLEFEGWTERVRSLLELAWWPLPFFSTVAQMEKLETDADAAQIGILEGIGMRKLLASPSLASSEAAKALKISKLEFRLKTQFQDLEVGHITDNVNVAVEYKSYEQDTTGSISEIVSRRILQLVALLHEAKDDRFRVLHCINYFDDVPRKRIGFVFELPRSETQMNLIPTTLNLKLLSKKTKPMLGARIKLAHTLAESIGLLHSVGWVHKSLRSENIIFFPVQEAGDESSDALLEKPQIFGFEYSRVVTDFSSGRPDFNIRRNIYRHPERWGQPSETFSKIHDIYGVSLPLISLVRLSLTSPFALGTILLEIGLWEPLSSIDGGALLNSSPNSTVAEMAESARTRLLKHARRRLGFYTGEKYQGVVLACLQGAFEGVDVDDRLGSRLSAEFGRTVVEVLRELSGCLGG